MKSLDAKLAEIKKDRSSRAFTLADAKDAGRALGTRTMRLHLGTGCVRLPVV
jgi:hypothetical protein